MWSFLHGWLPNMCGTITQFSYPAASMWACWEVVSTFMVTSEFVLILQLWISESLPWQQPVWQSHLALSVPTFLGCLSKLVSIGPTKYQEPLRLVQSSK